MDEDVFSAILAMDSYNRGDGAGVTLPSGTSLGNATLRNTPLPDGWQGAGFYATSYDWNGQTVISYRGTDNYNIFDSANDIWNGWISGFGFNQGSQAQLAIRFYENVAGVASLDEDPGAEIMLTGHSLGGGLAGFIASLTGSNALLFDHMPFGIAAALQGSGIADFNLTEAQPKVTRH